MDSCDLTLSLSGSQRRFIERQVADGEFGTAADFVRHLIDRECDRLRESEDVRRELAETIQRIKQDMGGVGDGA